MTDPETSDDGAGDGDPSPDEIPERIPNASVAEASCNGQLLIQIQHMPAWALDDPQAAALAVLFRHLADRVEDLCLDEPATEILEHDDVDFNMHDFE